MQVRVFAEVERHCAMLHAGEDQVVVVDAQPHPPQVKLASSKKIGGFCLGRHRSSPHLRKSLSTWLRDLIILPRHFRSPRRVADLAARREPCSLQIMPLILTIPRTHPLRARPGRSALEQLALIVFVSLTLNLVGNGRISLWDRDEPRYAGCTREMRASGDYIHPTFNAEPRYHKPILIYWLMLAGTAIGGDNPFGARLVSAIAGACTCAVIWLFGRKMFGPKVGLFAALMLATAPIFAYNSKLATTDATLTLFLTLCFYSLWEISRSANPRWQMVALFWVSLALVTLTKGPIGPVLLVLRVRGLLVVGRRPLLLQEATVELGPADLRAHHRALVHRHRHPLERRLLQDFDGLSRREAHDHRHRDPRRLPRLLPCALAGGVLPLVGASAARRTGSLEPPQVEPRVRFPAGVAGWPADLPGDRAHEADPLLPARLPGGRSCWPPGWWSPSCGRK